MFTARKQQNASQPHIPAMPKDDPKRRYPETTKVERLVGWKPTLGFEEGHERTIKWFVLKNAAYR